ncbi:MAG TPA: acyltransferase family protein, partial [Pseudonocardia sp.]|nr:acyltransferase family protein [Pseudonocardia sp.]
LLSAFVGAEILVLDSFAWTFMARYLFFFLLGCHARALVERLAEASSLLRAGAAAVVCAAAAGAAVALDARPIPGVAFLLNVLAVVFGVLLAAAVVRFRVARPLVTLGQQTLPVYLIHVLWLGAIAVYLQTVDLPLPVEYAAPALLTVLTTALSLLTHRVLVKAGGTWLFELPRRLAYRRPGTEGSSSVGASNR